MVSVTVILAAIIAAFVFGMAGDIQSTKVVAVTAHRIDSSHIQLTNMGGQDVTKLDSIAISGAGSGTLGTSVGDTTDIAVGTSPQARVIVLGTFKDGTNQVLLDTKL